MEKVKFKLQVITPLMMGGANHREELRTQSFNGVFRWWFRIAGGSLEDERRIFGWAGSPKAIRRGLVSLWFENSGRPSAVLPVEGENLKSIGDFVKWRSGLRYLAFPTLFQGNERKALVPNYEFTLVVGFHPMAGDEDVREFMATAWLSFNLGNFGYRSRRGFGSLKVIGVEGNTKGFSFSPPQGGIEDWIRKNINLIGQVFPLPHRDTDKPHIDGIYLYAGGREFDPLETLNRMAEGYKRRRKGLRKHERVFLGLPGVRRASPVYFKVFGNGQGIFVVLGGKFLPDKGNVPTETVKRALPVGGKIWP